MTLIKRTSITLVSLIIALVGAVVVFLMSLSTLSRLTPKLQYAEPTQAYRIDEGLQVDTTYTHSVEQANAVVNNGSQRELIR